MRTRRSLGDDSTESATAAGKPTTKVAQRRRKDRQASTVDPVDTERQASPSTQAERIQASGLNDEEGIESVAESAMREDGDERLELLNEHGTEAAARPEVTGEIKGTRDHLQKSSSFVAPRIPHPPRFQPELPPSSQASKTTSPTESHAGHIHDGAYVGFLSSDDAVAARSGRQVVADSSSGSKRKAQALRSDEATPARGRSNTDRLQPSNAPPPSAPHPTALLRRPPAFELPDSSPLERASSEDEVESSSPFEEGDSDITAGGGLRLGELYGDNTDDDALMLPAQEPTIESDLDDVPPKSAVMQAREWMDHYGSAPAPPPPLPAVSEESDGFPTATRRNLLPDLLQAEYGENSEQSSPRRPVVNNPPPPRRSAAGSATGPSQRPSAVPVKLGLHELSSQPALAEAEPNPFRTTMLTQLGDHRRSHSMAGHERAATHSTIAGNESSFLEADSFAARRLHSITRPAKARDSLGMRSRAPRAVQVQAPQPISGAHQPRPAILYGQTQILLGSADPCPCGFNGSGKRRRLSALNGSDGRLSDDSLLSGDGKENSPASTGRNFATGWEAHSKSCMTLREMRAQGWRIYREI